jgi:hypothetical protein
MKETSRYIWLVEESDFAETNIAPGWYFEDETEQFNGPYTNEQNAMNALEAYVSWLKGKGEAL